MPGCLEVAVPCFEDARGSLVKPVQRSAFADLGLPADFSETFFSRSARGVLRGLHFQTPPRALDKLVMCVSGEAFDVVLDLRKGSPTFGEHVVIGLSERRASAVLVPAGCAHGFLALAADTVLLYWVTEEHSGPHDAGIRWDSADIPWPLDEAPVVSPRDAALPALADYCSPFTFTG